MIFFFLLALLLEVQLTTSHMVMNTPMIYSPHKASTWPVTAPGAGLRFPYPCQGFTEVAYRTPITAGSTTLVNFTGSAPHGGGSCLFGVNYHSTESSPYTANPHDWKTIYTIIGGCPAETAGNLETPDTYRGLDPNGNPDSVHCGDDKGKDCIRQFNIPFPEDLPAGNATFAWIWYNQRTARELYMNCAPVTIVNEKKKAPAQAKPQEDEFVNKLPVMFLANIPGFTNCTTSTTGDQKGPFNIPNPGLFGVQLIEPDPVAAGSCPVAPLAPFAPGGSVPPPPPPPPKETPSTSSSVPAPVPSSQSSTSKTIHSTFLTSGFHTLTTKPTTSSPVATATTSVRAPPTSTPAGPPAGGNDKKCNVPGEVVCVSDSEMGICNPAGGVDNIIPLNPEQICVDGRVVYRGKAPQ